MTIARKLHWIFNVSCTLSSRNFLRKKEFSVQGLAIVIIVNKIGFSTRSDLSYAIVHRYILLGVSCFALYSQRLGSTLRSNEQPSLIFCPVHALNERERKNLTRENSGLLCGRVSISPALLSWYVLLVVMLIVGLLGQRATGYSQSLIKRPCLEFRLTGVEQKTALF